MISEAFYFGKNQTCFGHFTPASVMPSGKSLLIVPSIFGEAIRSHRVAREVTKKLSKQGIDVLRFDFDGDGNSCSETSKISLEVWLQNIKDAYTELSSRSPDTIISILAIRFGAGLSLLSLSSFEVEAFVFWDPILSRKEMYKVFVGSQSVNSDDGTQESDNIFEQDVLSDGFFENALDESFAQQFLKLNKISTPTCRVDIIETDSNTQQQEAIQKVSVCSISHRCDWQKKDLPVIFAPNLISTICDYF